MCYWDYNSIVETSNLNATRASGKPVVTVGVPESSKDMIKRSKELNGNKRI